MPNPILPERIDNQYRGHKAALWILGLTVALKAVIGFRSIVSGRDVAISADGIPLDTFPAAAADTIVSMFALTGVSVLTVCLLCVLVLVRYRAMVPLMFVVLLVERLGRELVLQVMPIPRTGSPPGVAVMLVLVALMVVGLVLSLRSTAEAPRQA